MLVARGFAVLAADALGWGSREGNGYEAQQALLAVILTQFGPTLAGVIAADFPPCVPAGAVPGGGRSAGSASSAFRSEDTAPGKLLRCARRERPGCCGELDGLGSAT